MDDRSQDMQKVITHLEDELKKIRAGRASASMLDGIMIEAYGTAMPLNQVASISTPEYQLLQVTPFDAANIQAIAAGIRQDNKLGLNPMDDGRVIRIQMPPLTTERRQQIVKQLGDKAEDAKIALRNIRHDALRDAKSQLKDKEMSEDDYKRVEKQLSERIGEFQTQVDELISIKENEIMSL